MYNPLSLTKIARAVIHADDGYARPYTNKYPACRTVKINVDNNHKVNAKLIGEIHEALLNAGSSGHSIKVIKSNCYYGVGNSLIVRIPNAQ